MQLGMRFASLLVAAWIGACATPLPEVPPVATTNSYHVGKIVWHDLVTPDLDRAQAFYGDLFGWTFERASRGYRLVKHDGRLIGGMASLDRAGESSYWIPLVSVPDVDQAATMTASAGGKTLLKPLNLPRRGRLAVLTDPLGAAFGVLRSSDGDPPDAQPKLGEWLWREVWTDDVDAAAQYYEVLAGYQSAEVELADHPYRMLKRDGRPRLGVVRKPDPRIGNAWLVYVRVEEAEAIAARAESLGGKVLMKPNAEVRSGSVAILADPQGAGFAVQEWNP